MTPEETQKLIESTENLETTFLGSTQSRIGVEENITLDDGKRRTHVLNVGPTGHGKSQLLLHVALQDAYKDHGICVINPKGGLITELLAKLPENRLDDVVYINPGYDQVTPVNVLEPHTHEEMSEAEKENQKEIIVSDLIDLFKRQSENWGDQFGRVLETLLRAHLDLNIKQNDTKTLLDVFQCVIQGEELSELIDRTQDPVIREQLVRVKEDMSSYEMEPLQRRLNDFVMNTTIRRIIGAEESGVDFRKAVNQGKIVLVDIQKGEVGGTVSELVGSIVITKVWAAAQSRVNQEPSERRPFYLFVDELQNFAGEGSNFTKILSEAREYRLGCWLATQYLHQLAPEMRRAVTNNCRTKIFFNPSGSEDTNRIAGMLQDLTKQELKQMGKYRAAIQKPGETHHSNAVILDTLPPFPGHREPEEIQELKKNSSHTTENIDIELEQDTGEAGSSGGEKHDELLLEAKQYLEFEENVQVNLLHQDGTEKPDGHIIREDRVDHLEAEHTTLSKPEKVLRNLQRATDQNRRCIYIIEESQLDRLQDVLEDVHTDNYRILTLTDIGVTEP